MLIYYPTLYIVNRNTLEEVYEAGLCRIMFQEYSGMGYYKGSDYNTFNGYLMDGLENYSQLLVTIPLINSSIDTFSTKFSYISVPVPIRYPDEYQSATYTFKLVFPYTGDYLIKQTEITNSNANWKGYDKTGQEISFLTSLFGFSVDGRYSDMPTSQSNTTAVFNMISRGGIDYDNNKIKTDNLNNTYIYRCYHNEDSSYEITAEPGTSAQRFINFFNRQTANQPPQPPDPYEGAGDSTTGGGGGSFDGSSDPIDIPSLPPVGATNTGFISLFVPSESQVRSVANYLWSSFFDVSTFFKIFENPMDCILGLSVVPVTVPTSGSAQITVGNIELSGITLPLASAQYVEVDCGTISFENKFFGSYLDYEPYTKIAIFLPYCGVHQINADDIMGKVIRVVYHVDILTGSCVAFVKCGDSVLYQFNGACATNIPITNISYNSTIENAIRIAVNIGTTVATAGASAPLSAGAETVGHTAQNIARGVSLAGSTAEGALSLKPSIGRSGALGGTTGILAGQKPYLIINRPRLCKPKDQNTYKGYPSFVQTTVGDLIGKGYTEFDTIIISTLYLTDNEEAELEKILQGGVYL